MTVGWLVLPPLKERQILGPRLARNVLDDLVDLLRFHYLAFFARVKTSAASVAIFLMASNASDTAMSLLLPFQYSAIEMNASFAFLSFAFSVLISWHEADNC